MGAIHNDFSGSAHNVVQVGHHHGDLIIQNLPAIPPPAVAPPWLVPAPTRGFVNRVLELSRFGELVVGAEDAPAIVVCTGLRGVGKSATARRFAHLMRSQFPGGQLYVDYAALRHRGGAPVGEALAGCLRDLGVDDDAIPAGVAERSRLFRSKTSRAAVLVVLDDVGEPEHVRALMPNAPGSVVLATSDAVLGELLLDGAYLMELQPLSDEDSLLLLSQRCGPARITNEAEAAEALVTVCAGLPVALNVVAARLVTDPRLGVAQLVAELSDERQRLRGFAVQGELVVRSVFSTAYRNLPEPAARLYRRLGMLPGPDFTPEVIADVDGALPVLVAHGLIQPEESNRYRFHRLVRLHAAEEGAADPEAVAAVEAVVRRYLRRAVQADRAVMGPRTRYSPVPASIDDDEVFEDAPQALAWLERERANLMAALRMADDRGWSEVVWSLAETLTALFYNHRHLADWYESGTLGATAARACGSQPGEARMWLTTTRAMTELGRSAEVEAALDRAAELAEAAGVPVLLGSVWEFRGRQLQTSEPLAAIAAFEQSIEFNLQAGEERGAALAEFFLGTCLTAAGRPEEAIDRLDDALRTLEKVGDFRMASRALAALADPYVSLGRDQEAAALLEQAVQQLADRQAFHYEEQALEQLAAVRERLGDHDGASACRARVLDIQRMLGAT